MPPLALDFNEVDRPREEADISSSVSSSELLEAELENEIINFVAARHDIPDGPRRACLIARTPIQRCLPSKSTSVYIRRVQSASKPGPALVVLSDEFATSADVLGRWRR